METVPAPLLGKVALVTGGSRGIGAGIALKLAEQGCTSIAITYSSNSAKAEEVMAAIRALSPRIRVCAFAADLLDADFGEHVVQQALAGLQVEHLDIVVSNAANLDTDAMTPVAALPKREWDEMMTANAWAPLSLARAAVVKMPPGGRIIMISSTSSKSRQGDPLLTYAASKAALDSVSRNMAGLWGVQYGVTVNSISVGATVTDSLKRALRGKGEAVEQAFKNFSLLKRYGEVKEIAAIVAFIASPDASWIIGNQIPANGGGLSIVQS